MPDVSTRGGRWIGRYRTWLYAIFVAHGVFIIERIERQGARLAKRARHDAGTSPFP